MIVADRREGGILDNDLASASRPTLWRTIDARVPLEAKVLIPLVVVTLAVSTVFGYLLDSEQESAALAAAQAGALRVANSAVAAYLATPSSALDSALSATAMSQPRDTKIWIIDLLQGGAPVIASSEDADVGKDGMATSTETASARAGLTSQDEVQGGAWLQTVVPIAGREHAVVVQSTLAPEAEAARMSAVLIGLAVLAVCVLEIGAAMFVLEAGVMRRIRRIRATVGDFGHSVDSAHLAEGSREKGNDVLRNLAIEVDEKLMQLGQHERVDDVISELGVLALQSAGPAQLAERALEITRSATGLEKCFLVDVRGKELKLDVAGANGHASPPSLPIWAAALVRAAAVARRPILCDGLGTGSRYWEAESAKESAAAAFVPLPGPQEPLGVMVGIAGAGRRLAPSGISLMEAVATALGESLQRGEALKAQHESDVKSEALSTVSHEMRSPINSVIGFTDLLLGEGPGALTDQQRDYLKRISAASENLRDLVDNYLDLARVMAGSLSLHREPVPIAPEIEQVVNLLEPMARERGVVVRVNSAPELTAYVDRLRTRQVLTNLVSNAIKFTPARGHVRVEAAGGTNGVRVSVIDTGIGIPLDRQHLVFKEFAQIRDDAGGDTGLGLALTKRFVDAMGGFIRFTSSPGSGTVFDIWLPGERSPVAAGTATATPA